MRRWLVLLLILGTLSPLPTWAQITPAPQGHIIRDEGTVLPQRPYLNMVGPLIACTDDAANRATKCTNTTTISAGTGTGTYKPSGVILRNTTTQATVGTSEETLATVTIPGNTLAVDGQALRFTAYFTTAANTNSKIARLRWNGTGGTVMTAASTASSGSAVVIQAMVIRTGASAQILGGAGMASAPNVATTTTTDSILLSGDIVVYVRGTTATAIGDLTFQALLVEYLP
jgi:hypothetical protein